MRIDEFENILNKIQIIKCETQTLELKSAKEGCPKRLYDSLSSFSNQNQGGVIIFGVDESSDYSLCGVYDPQDLQKKINEQCLQMEPRIRPLLTVLEKDNKTFVACEVPGIELSDRPCFYKGRGKLNGSYVRVGDSDEPMTEYEIYSYESSKKRIQDDSRPIDNIDFSILNQDKVYDFLRSARLNHPNFANMGDDTIFEVMGLKKNNKATIASLMIFGDYPQAYFPNLSIVATSVSSDEIGDYDENDSRFIDNRRIEGTIPQMLNEAVQFVKKNIKIGTFINPSTGMREDKPEYPLVAIREAVLNALIHRDYSMYTDTMPIVMTIYNNRIEISNPGGLYGGMSVSSLGHIQPMTRNVSIVRILEEMKITKNRYSGIPTIRKQMEKASLKEPVFINERGTFKVILYKHNSNNEITKEIADRNILEFCKEERSRDEIVNYLGFKSASYAIKQFIQPLVDKGLIELSIPTKPSSKNQRYKSR